ncbi:class III lanthionine synthetase LanKC [Actinocrinis puniceicyclus]|uniref:Class III lanthionine synthetase LanKC n=1 Tax=Actinocrinis puniceicyclus TaxID=977794 RepID=A0A8J8BBJ4_9ACTN|nr:class III lanthionine synthetase LanKC [Actinocrinis puniceicyclus]MBS2964117.1 class III lanthionine synthetase LanKC [Actinocrinis puniceicyclus]
MDVRYEPFCFADPVFYDTPERWQRAVADFPATAAAVPAGWTRAWHGLWCVCQPDGARLPVQGWKIHVSATPDNAERIVDTVYEYCIGRRVAFKFLRGPAALLMQNSKYAPRGASGKLLTLYPVDETELERTLSELDALVGGEPGPYVLSDLRWNAGPLYTRYGAFAEFYHVGEGGARELALRRPDGGLVTDRRGPVFSLPEWVKLPAFLEPQLAARDAQRFELPYQIERVLHFSNGGGIYLARPNDAAVAGGGKVVLKEGRPYSGLDQGGVDAIARLGHEREILDRLRGLGCVPRVVEYATAWEHHFLVETFVEGETLNSAFVRDFPLVHPGQSPEKLADYAAWAVRTADRVARALAEVHERGVVFGDLHPNNVMLRPDGGVVFLDFELASPVDDYTPPRLGAGGFAAPRSLRGFDVDRYALASLRLWMLLPVVAMLHLDRQKAGQLMASIQRYFPLPDGYFDTGYLHAAVPEAGPDRSGPPTVTADPHVATLLDPDGPHDWPSLRSSLSAAIAAAATPERTDRLFPGDIEQFARGGHGHGLAYGAAGVLYALHAGGAQVDPAHVDWLVEASRRDPVTPGALTGTHGTAYALDVLGRRDAALNLLDRLAEAKMTASGIGDAVADLTEGLAGIGLVDLHFARVTGHSAWRDSALLAADRLAAHLAAAGERRAERLGEAREGLVHGASGAALLAVRLYEETGDTGLLDLAEDALRRDLDACRNMADGTVQLADGTRVLPYVAVGSAGIGLVLREYLAHRPDSPLAAFEPGIARACDVEFVIQSGLFNGRAGMITYLTRLRDAAADAGGLDLDAVIERHIRRLTWHAMSYRGHLAFPGDQLLRLSMDLASGGAGILLALNAALAAGDALPFFGRGGSTATTPTGKAPQTAAAR